MIIDIIVEKLDHLPDLNSIVVISNDRFFEQFYRWAEALDRTNKTPILVMNDGTTNESNKRGAIGDIEFVIKELDIKEDVCILAGDNIFTYDLCKMYEFFKKKDADKKKKREKSGNPAQRHRIPRRCICRFLGQQQQRLGIEACRQSLQPQRRKPPIRVATRTSQQVKLAFSAAKKYPRECKTARIDIDRRMTRVICDWRDKK